MIAVRPIYAQIARVTATSRGSFDGGSHEMALYDNISNLGLGTGAFAAKPGLCTLGGLAKDFGTVASVLPVSAEAAEVEGVIKEAPAAAGELSSAFRGIGGIDGARNILQKAAKVLSEAGKYTNYLGRDTNGNIQYAGITNSI